MNKNIESLFKEARKYSKIHYESAIKNITDRPYWMWVSVIDSISCDTCKALNDKVFMWNDPIWAFHLPPIHKTCRCGFRCLDEYYIIEKGLKVSIGADYFYLFEKPGKYHEVY